MNYYDVLGVRPSASDQEIELAYRSRRTQYHPDKYASADAETVKWATAKMQEVNAAYAVLSDLAKRRAFDEGFRRPDQARPDTAEDRRAHAKQATNRGAEPVAEPRLQVALRNILQRELAPYHGFARTYVAPRIPARKLNAARGSYAMDIKEDDVLVLIDATVFGGAKEGLILTSEGIRIKELMAATNEWRWKDVRSLEVRGTALHLNGYQVADCTMVDKPELQRLFAVVREFLGQLRPPAPESAAPRTAQADHSDMPWTDPALCQELYSVAKRRLLELSNMLEPVERELAEEWLDRQSLAKLFELLLEAFGDPKKAKLAYRWVLTVGQLCEAAVESLSQGAAPIDPELLRGSWDEPVAIVDLRSMLKRLFEVIREERERSRTDRFFER
jgi:hypothetical protein